MHNVMTKAEIWKESVLIYIDNAYSVGMSTEAILADVKQIVSETELGDMEYTLDLIMAEWKADRGIA